MLYVLLDKLMYPEDHMQEIVTNNEEMRHWNIILWKYQNNSFIDEVSGPSSKFHELGLIKSHSILKMFNTNFAN